LYDKGLNYFKIIIEFAWRCVLTASYAASTVDMTFNDAIEVYRVIKPNGRYMLFTRGSARRRAKDYHGNFDWREVDADNSGNE
jgi:hypothetical protein